MDVAIYSGILKWRGENPYSLVESDSQKTIPLAEKVFRQDILHDKCVWVNQRKQDFVYFIQSRHPLVSCFQCPDKHPYSKQERRGTLFIMLSLGSFWAFVSCLLALYGAQSIGIDLKGLGPSKEVLLLRVLCSLGNGVVLWFCDLSLTQMQSCVCAERQRRQHCYLLLRCCSSLTIWIYFAISFVMVSFTVYMVVCYDLAVMFFMVFALQFTCSWCFQFAALYLRFNRQWHRDHRMAEGDAKSAYYLTYRDYEEYRYSTKLESLSPRNRSNPSSPSSSLAMDAGPLLMEMDCDVVYADEDVHVPF